LLNGRCYEPIDQSTEFDAITTRLAPSVGEIAAATLDLRRQAQLTDLKWRFFEHAIAILISKVASSLTVARVTLRTRLRGDWAYPAQFAREKA
jgi:hypothetical protein